MDSLLLKILDTTLIVGLSIFVVQISHSYLLHRRKVKASIQLVIHYAEKARENINGLLNTYEYGQKQIIKGNPYGEPNENYTPVLLAAKQYELTFEQVSEILRYLNKEQQTALLDYFSLQSDIDALIDSVNSDYFRAMPQKRKADAFEMLITMTKSLEPVVGKLHQALN